MKLINFCRTKYPVVFLALFLPMAALAAADTDWGVTLHNSTAMEKTVQGGDATLDQLDSAALWFETAKPLANGGRLSFAGEVLAETSSDHPYLFDLDYLRLYAWMPKGSDGSSVTEVTAGRFVFSDPSGYIIAHPADGLRLRRISPSVVFDLSGGYTGLLLNPKSDIRMSSADWSEKNDEKGFFFGPRRVFADATVTFPGSGTSNGLSFYALGQFDLRSESDQVKIDTQYLGMSFSKLHGSNLYSKFFINGEFAQIKNPNQKAILDVGLLMGLNLKYIREDAKGSHFDFLLLAAPPDFATDLIPGIDVGVLGYLPISQPTLGINVSPEMKGLGLLGMKYSMRPFMGSGNAVASRFQAEIGGRGYFRTWPVNVTWISTDPDSDSVYLGTEIEGGFQWRIFSDLGVGLNSAVFLPSSAVTQSDMLWTVRMDVSVSL